MKVCQMAVWKHNPLFVANLCSSNASLQSQASLFFSVWYIKGGCSPSPGRCRGAASHRTRPCTLYFPVSSKAKATQIRCHGLDVSTNSTSRRRQRRPQNIDGEFFVDHTCIDCDTCRWMAPEVFSQVDGLSAVYKQPSCQAERLKALQALLSCPTSSIHTEKPAQDILEVQKTFPLPIDERRIPGVFHCGYHSDKSYGAASYVIVHSEGNILIDSPRYTESLARNIESMGGARFMFLTHRDDVADHKKWSERLGCERIIHSEEVNSSTADVEIKLTGSGPWTLCDDIVLVHTPGHTEGSVCLFYKPLKVLFTGDHFQMGEAGLCINEWYNWFSVKEQVNSVKKLLDLDFEWILPGHGRRAEFKDVEDKNTSLQAFLASKLQHA